MQKLLISFAGSISFALLNSFALLISFAVAVVFAGCRSTPQPRIVPKSEAQVRRLSVPSNTVSVDGMVLQILRAEAIETSDLSFPPSKIWTIRFLIQIHTGPEPILSLDSLSSKLSFAPEAQIADLITVPRELKLLSRSSLPPKGFAGLSAGARASAVLEFKLSSGLDVASQLRRLQIATARFDL